MESIKEYLLSALGACVIIGYAENLVSENLRSYVKFISGLFIVLLLASPALCVAADFMTRFEDFEVDAEIDQTDKYGAGYEGIVGEFENSLCESVRDYISQRCEIDKKDIEVSVETDKSDISNIKIIKINIIIYQEFDCGAISRMVEAHYGAETETVYQGEQAD